MQADKADRLNIEVSYPRITEKTVKGHCHVSSSFEGSKEFYCRPLHRSVWTMYRI